MDPLKTLNSCWIQHSIMPLLLLQYYPEFAARTEINLHFDEIFASTQHMQAWYNEQWILNASLILRRFAIRNSIYDTKPLLLFIHKMGWKWASIVIGFYASLSTMPCIHCTFARALLCMSISIVVIVNLSLLSEPLKFWSHHWETD